MKTVKAYECEGNLSLDKEYLADLAGGKFKVYTVLAELTEDAFEALQEAGNNTFDFELYDSYREDMEDEKADDYFEKNAKCISTESYDVDILEREAE
jgi:hypothetical protein